MRSPATGVLWTLPLLCTTILAQSLPYNPTTILLPQTSSHNKDIAYTFLQNQLLSLNISSSLSASNLSFETLTSSLPFPNGETSAFTPSIDSAGEISVYAGSCASSTSPEIWQYTPSNTSVEKGVWAQAVTNIGRGVAADSISGAGFLARGLSFSPFVEANVSNIYIFGGMCPKAEATASTWQSAALYSNRMLKFGPSRGEYTLTIPTSRGPPIPEAGFSITGLIPTSSNKSGILTHQQNFILLGGHTQTAFTNMSLVAIWSLPEESWSFVTIDPPKSNANIELAIKSTDAIVDSRSGHTSVLTEDGSRIIVYGGWVGNTEQAADPQLAILNVGTGFGGEGDWEWVVPEEQPSGSGIFGHGAVMLPGNIMMVLGGFNISSTGNAKRQDAAATHAMFFNATSMSWISDYVNPAYTAARAAEKKASSSSSSSNAKNVGLGAGLGLGLAALIGALVVFCWYNRRMRRRREAREQDIRNLSVVSAEHYTSSGEMEQRRGGFPWANGGWNNSASDRHSSVYESNSAVAGYENVQSGIHNIGDEGAYPIPPQPPIARKPLNSRGARGLYQPTPNFDLHVNTNQGRANSLGTAGPIHPIYEADEEDQISRKSRQSNDGVDVPLGDEAGMPQSYRYSDPFKDPPANPSSYRREPRNVNTPDALESPAESRQREVQEWVSDWAAADVLLNSQARYHSNTGRISPTRRAQLIAASSVSSVSAEEDSGRTGSNLSDGSIAVSNMSISRSGSSSQGRNNSLRGFIANAMSPFSAAVMSSTAPSTALSPDGYKQPPAPKSAGSTSSSFTTAHTSFPTLQVEGETLLPRPDISASGRYSPTRSQPDSAPGSPSKSKGTGIGRGGKQASWIGSLRRVVGLGDAGAEYMNPEFQPVPSRDPSPVRSDNGTAGSVEPRRTMSASATLWRRKQGKGDWEDSAEVVPGQMRSSTFTGDLASARDFARREGYEDEDDEEEWDIERAVQNRVVQVMFTVPKEKLRVVNHNMDDDLSSVGGSLRSKKGSGKSIKSMKTFDESGLRAVVEEEGSPVVDKGKGKETELDDSRSVASRKRRSRVLDMVEMMEGKSSPERTPDRSPERSPER